MCPVAVNLTALTQIAVTRLQPLFVGVVARLAEGLEFAGPKLLFVEPMGLNVIGHGGGFDVTLKATEATGWLTAQLVKSPTFPPREGIPAAPSLGLWGAVVIASHRKFRRTLLRERRSA